MFKKVIGKACRNPDCEFKDKVKEDYNVMCDCGHALEDVTITNKTPIIGLVIVAALVLGGGGYLGVMKAKAYLWKTGIDRVKDTVGGIDRIKDAIGGFGGGGPGKSTPPPPNVPTVEGAKEAAILVSNGMNSVKENKLDQAETAFSTASQKDPTNDQAFGNLGGVYSLMGKNDEGLRASLRAIQLNPRNYVWHLTAAELYSKKGERDNALAELGLAITNGFKQKDIVKTLDFKNVQDDPRFKTLVDKMS